jgi:hypothetical protein
MENVTSDYLDEVKHRNRLREESQLPLLDPSVETARMESIARGVAFERWLSANWSLYKMLVGDVSNLSPWGRMGRAGQARKAMKRLWLLDN